MSEPTDSTEQSDQSPELVPVCPDCDSTGVRETVRDTTDHDYYCRDCGATAIEPELRERKGQPARRGLAGRLASMDPDELGDDDDRLVTDGGAAVVYYAAGQYDVYHERRDCRHLRKAASIRELAVESMNGSRDPCRACADSLEGEAGDDRLVTDGGQRPIPQSAKEWVEGKLLKCTFVEWDRFTVGDDQEEDGLVITVYGWIDRDDEYKDFVTVEFWTARDVVGFTTSSEEFTERLHRLLVGENLDSHNECRRVENTFEVPNAVTLHEDQSLDAYTDGGLDQDIEEIGVDAGDGEAWAEAAGRLRDRDDDRWHYCICGARYRSRRAALQCCGDRFDDLDDGEAGEIVTDGGTHPMDHGHDTLESVAPPKGLTPERLECPKCGEVFGNLPNHLRACEGGEPA